MRQDTTSPTYRAYVMFILVVVYTFNFIDRQIIGILAVPIKADLALTDTQLGLMGGLAFALFYTALGIPIAMLADRTNRTWIMTIALTVWSAMTALCGTVQSFWQLFLARLGVGVGEAGGVAPAYSLISDYFPPQQRARALGIYSFGIPIGSALGIVFGGVIASKVDWRYAFFAVGIAGVLIAPIFKLTVAEPQRGRFDANHSTDAPPSLGTIVRKLTHKPSFWIMSFGAACSSMMGYGLFFWLPSFFVRSYSISLLDASLFYGAILLVGGLAGIWLGGSLADRFGADKRGAYVVIPALAFVATVPFLRGRDSIAQPDDNFLRDVGSYRNGTCLARSGPVRNSACCSAKHAGNRIGDFPVHQQFDRHRRWNDGNRNTVGQFAGKIR